MKKLIGIFTVVLFLSSCGGGNAELKKGMLNDINELCKCGISIRKGEKIAECGKMQEDIRGKYKAANDLLTQLDEKVKACVDDNMKE